MSTDTDFEFTHQAVYDNNIVVAAAVNQPNGRFMSRSDAASDLPHNFGEIVYHPDYPGLTRSGQNHALTKGSIKIELELEPEANEEVKANYISWFNQENNLASIGCKYEFNDNKYTVTYTTEFTQTKWRDILMTWSMPSSFAKLSVTGDSSDLLCFQRIDGNPDAWTIKYRDIPAGTSAVLEKTGNICYMIFSEEVTKGSTTLSIYKAYKITSNNIEVNASNNTKVFRLSRD